MPPDVAVDAARVHGAELRRELVAADLSRDVELRPKVSAEVVGLVVDRHREAGRDARAVVRASVVGSENVTSTVARSDDRTSGSASSSS